jgi:hypothetical protein
VAESEAAGPSVMTWVRNLGAVIALVAGVLGLLFLFWPEGKPEAEADATKGAATLSELRVDPDATRAQYLQSLPGGDPTGFTPAQLAERGALVSFRVELNGFRDVPVTIRHQLIDDGTGVATSDERTTTITPPENEIARDWFEFVPLPARGGSYYVVVQLLAEGETAPLADEPTEVFDAPL